jgi:hypothetical protein
MDQNATFEKLIGTATPASLYQSEPQVDHYKDPWDVTDAWLDADNEFEGEVHAYFNHNDFAGGDCVTFKGLSITDNGITIYMDAERGIQHMGSDTIARLSRLYEQELAEAA